MMPFIYVFLGGGLGSICRYGISWLLSDYKLDFPWATLIANFLACILLGTLSAYALKIQANDFVKYTFAVGFCGGFSTFSTFSNETFQLLEIGEYYLAFANIIVSVLICLLGIFIGYAIFS